MAANQGFESCAVHRAMAGCGFRRRRCANEPGWNIRIDQRQVRIRRVRQPNSAQRTGARGFLYWHRTCHGDELFRHQRSTDVLQTCKSWPSHPACWLPDNQYFNFGGKQYAEATFGFQYQFVGNLDPALSSRPAKPGDSILLYAIGLGDTTPANTPGVVATGHEVLNAPVLVNFGSTPATVNRVGLYPTFAGLYYIMLTVPTNLADNDYQINVTVGGQPLQQSPFYLTVHK